MNHRDEIHMEGKAAFEADEVMWGQQYDPGRGAYLCPACERYVKLCEIMGGDRCFQCEKRQFAAGCPDDA